MKIGLFENIIISRALIEADYKDVEYAHSNELCHVFNTDIGLVAVCQETGKFDSKEYKLWNDKLAAD